MRHGAYVLYDSVYQRLDYVGAFVNPAFAHPEWRDWVVTLSGLSKMDMFGASTGARACWLVMSDQIQSGGIRAREVIANLSAWLIATPSTLAQDWALAALQSPLAAIRQPSPYMRERRDFMAQAADAIAPLGVERTDFGGTFYSPLAFPGLIGEAFERTTHGFRERAVVRTAVDAFDFLLTANVGGIPFTAFAGRDPDRFGTWQRLSYGSKDVSELAVFIERVRDRIECQGRLGSSAPAAAAATAVERPIEKAVWTSACTRTGYAAFDGLDARAFADARRQRAEASWPEAPRLTGTKHPDSTTHRAAQLARALAAAPADAPDRAAAGPEPSRMASASSRLGRSTRKPSPTCSGPATKCWWTSKAGRSAPSGWKFPRRCSSRSCATAWCPGTIVTCSCACPIPGWNRTRRRSRRSSR